MTNIQGFQEHTAIITKDILMNRANAIVMIHITKNDEITTSHSIEFDNNADIYKLIGAIEALKATLINRYIEGVLPNDDY